MAEGIDGLSQVVSRIGRMATDIKRPEHALKAAGEYLVGSVKRTILAGGRPKPFTPLAASTIAARRKGKGRGGAKPLMNFGNLLASIGEEPVSSGGDAGVMVGTNYGKLPKGGSIAATLHFGGRGPYTIAAKNAKALAFMGADGGKV